MKNWIKFILALTLIGAANSCVDDKGNYTYLEDSEVMPVTIGGLEEQYFRKALSTLQLKPTLEGIKNDENYDFMWYIYGSGANRTNWRDTISYEKDLDYTMAVSSGEYKVTLKIRDKKTDVCAYKTVRVTVTSPFSHGWYVVKDENNVTDVDLVAIDTTSRTLYPNVLTSINGEGIPGEGLKASYLSDYYRHSVENEDGTVTTLTGQKALFVLSKGDMRVYDAETMTLFKTFEEAFIEVPEVKQPQDVFAGMTGVYVLNGGKLHWIQNFYDNVGKFGYPVLNEGAISKNMLRHATNGALVFDESTASFMGAPFAASALNTLSDGTVEPSCNQMNCDLVFMSEQTAYYGFSVKGLALLKNRSTGTYYGAVLNMNWNKAQNPIANFVKIPEDREVTKAAMWAQNNNNEVVYFSAGDNRVGMYNLSNTNEDAEMLEYEIGEKVAAIKHISYTSYATGDKSLSCLSVLTNKGGNWKLYLYNFVGSTPDIVSPAYETHTGTGNGRFAFYRGMNSSEIN